MQFFSSPNLSKHLYFLINQPESFVKVPKSPPFVMEELKILDCDDVGWSIS